MEEHTIDLGGGITAEWVGWSPDRTIQSNAERYAGIDDLPHACLELRHKRPDGAECLGIVTIDSPVARKVFPTHPRWTMHSENPLTLTPSVLCSCGWHGFITDGKWRNC